MTVKIDRYAMSKSKYRDNEWGVYDYLSYRIIASFDSSSESLNRLLAKIVLDELNTGKYEEELKIDGN